MASGAAQVMIRVGAQVSDAVNEFQKLDRAVGEHLTKTEKVQNAVRRAAVPAGIALAAMGYAAIDATKAAAEDAEAQTKLAGTLERVTGANKQAIAGAEDYISALSQQVGVADDELRPALGKLATATGDLTKAQDLLKVALDVSAQTGKPLEAVSTALSKAYAGNEGALKKLLPGIDEAILKSGDFSKIQGELARLTGGAASESANTAAGQFRRLGITLQETKEAIGAALLPILNAFLPILQKVATFVQNNSNLFVILGGVVAGVAATVLTVNAAMSAWNAVSTIARAATVAFSIAQAALNLVLSANPIGIVIVALGALAAAVVVAWNNSETFRNVVKSVWDGLKDLWGFLSPIASTAFDGLKVAFDVVKGSLSNLKDVFSGAKALFQPVIDFLSEHKETIFQGIKLAFATLTAPITLLKVAFDAISPVIEPVINTLKAVGKGAFAAIATAFSAVASTVSALYNAMVKLKGIWDAFWSSWEKKNVTGNPLTGPSSNVGAGIPQRKSNTEILVAPSAQLVVDEEAVARAILSILERSDGRNGTPVYG